MKNTGVIRKIDELGRIVIPKEIRKNLNIREGADVQIYVEEDKIILKKYQKMYSIKESAQKYLDIINKLLISDIFITDKEKVIASSNQKYLNEVIDSKVISLINGRKQENGKGIKFGKIEENLFYSVFPIIVDADAIGSIVLLNIKEIDEKDRVVVSVLNSILSNLLY